MRLKNKKTGQLGNFILNKDHFECVDLDYVPEYRNLAELNAEWEDYEESVKPYWFINDLDGEPMKCDLKNCDKAIFIKWGEHRKEIGNYFETKEKAEKAMERLRAWKRLKDKGFRFDHIRAIDGVSIKHKDLDQYTIIAYADEDGCDQECLDLLFGGEE